MSATMSSAKQIWRFVGTALGMAVLLALYGAWFVLLPWLAKVIRSSPRQPNPSAGQVEAIEYKGVIYYVTAQQEPFFYLPVLLWLSVAVGAVLFWALRHPKLTGGEES